MRRNTYIEKYSYYDTFLSGIYMDSQTVAPVLKERLCTLEPQKK